MKFTAIRKWNNKLVLGGAVFETLTPDFIKGDNCKLMAKNEFVDCIQIGKPMFRNGKLAERQLFSRHFWFNEYRG